MVLQRNSSVSHVSLRWLPVLLLLLLSAGTCLGVPALQVWTQALLADGTPVDVLPVGDEWHHYFIDADGRSLTANADGTLRYDPSVAQIQPAGSLRRARAMSLRQQRRQRQQCRAASIGPKRGLIILVAFADQAFSESDPKATWSRLANEPDYVDGSVYGSVHDYFMAQSYGQFDLNFDVVGPVELPHPYAYYGSNDQYGDDANVGELVHEACLAVSDSVSFSDYDWDGDGEVDQVYFIYAGYGENDNSWRPTLIWPHQWYLSEWEGYEQLELDGVLVDSYACSSELKASGALSGIGTICHEFSHCLGLPDLYNTERGGTVLGSWDLMDMGCYNGGSWRPCNYSAYERYYCGWLQLQVLNSSTVVEALEALGNGGEAYQLVNECDDASVDEFYVLENRQKAGWDAFLPGSGLLVTHVDYDSAAWFDNIENNVRTHLGVSFISPGSMTSSGATYPRNGLDSLTDNSSPAAAVFHENIHGTKFMGKPITNITNEDGLVSFTFTNPYATGISAPLLLRRRNPLRPVYDMGNGILISPRGKKYFRKPQAR